MIKQNKITVVVSAYNEEKTVKGVIDGILNCPSVDEIIVVDDGSTDKTPEIINRISSTHLIQSVRFEKNKGKSYAMTSGVEQSTGDIIVFIDADLIGLNCKHIESLVFPLINGKADQIIGRRVSDTNPKVDVTGPMDDWLGGERALYKEDLLPILDQVRETKFGVETLLNLYLKSKKKKSQIVDLKDLIHIRKYKKYKWNTAVLNYGKSASQIVRTVFANYFLVFVVAKNIFTNFKG